METISRSFFPLFQVFSVKYFPSGSIFDAKVASGSYAWQSIVKASKLVQLGLLWRVGNGLKINIYNDKWLPGEGSACVVSPKIEEASNWVVANLLEPEGGGWNEQLVDALFLPFEAQRIRAFLCVLRTKMTAYHGQGVGWVLTQLK